jgi:hypothetical protein
MGLVALSSVLLVLVVGDPDPQAELWELAEAFETESDEVRLRRLLNAPADASYGHLHRALVGRALVGNEALFRKISEGEPSDRERRVLRDLAMLGGAIYEHYPELKPDGYEIRVRGMGWLSGFR